MLRDAAELVAMLSSLCLLGLVKTSKQSPGLIRFGKGQVDDWMHLFNT